MQFVRYVLYHNRMKRYGIHHLLCLGVEGGGSNTDNVSLLNYFGKIKTSCLDLIFFSSFVKRLSGIKCRILEGGVQSQEQFICGQVVLILSAARSSSQINSGYCLNISWY